MSEIVPATVVVSVVIPTYNQADLLRKALQSVTNQTFQDWEAIVIDNYSTDSTRDIVESFSDKRIRYISFANNGIIAASRNCGIRLAKGEYIAFLDSDDLWYPSKLSMCLNSLRNGGDAACHALQIYKDGVLAEKIIPKATSGNMYHSLLYEGNPWIATSAVIVKKQCFNQFGVFSEDMQIVTAEDYELWIRLSKNDIRWCQITEVLGEYTLHEKNASSNIKKQMLAEENVVRNYFRDDKSSRFTDKILYRKRLLMIRLRAGKRTWESGNYFGSLRILWSGLFRFW